MIPIRLTIKGLYSYREEQEIDFTRLMDAQLFGIFGGVGSGKSSILEAISYALYDNIERLNKKGDERYYNMLNLKSSELLIRFQFAAGEDPREEYMVEVTGKRNRKQFRKVNPYTRRTFRKVNGEWQPEDWRAEDVLHLSYQNFRRTIIIPQGKFQEFLQLTGGDRTKMMKELFHLERFDLQGKTKVLSDANRQEMESLKGQLLEVGEVTRELIAEKTGQLNDLQTAADKMEKALRKKEAREKEWQQLKDLTEKLANFRKTLQELESQEAHFREEQQRLEEYEYCVKHFKSAIEQLQEIRRREQNLAEELREQSRQESELKVESRQETEIYQELKEKYEKREELQERAREFEIIIQLQRLEEQILEHTGAVERLLKGLEEIEGKIARTKADQGDILTQIKQHRKNMPDRAQLVALQQWYHTAGVLSGELEKTGEALTEQAAAIEKLAAQKNRLLDEPELEKIITPLERNLPIPDLLLRLDDLHRELEKRLKEIDSEVAHLRFQAGLEDYAAKLKKGEPCPLCGSTEHPRKLKPGKIRAQLEQMVADRELLTEKLKAVNTIRREMGEIAGEWNTRQKQLENLEEQRASLQKKRAAHWKAFRWEGFSPDDREAAERAVQSTQEIELTISELEQRQEKLSVEMESFLKEKDRLQKQLGEHRQQQSAAQSQFETLLKQLRRLQYPTWKNIPEAELKGKAEELRKRYERLGEEYREAETHVQQLQKQLHEITGKIAAGKKTLTGYRKDADRLSKQLTKKIAESSLPDIETVEKILALETDSEQMRRGIERFQQQLHAAREQVKQLEGELKGKAYDAAAHHRLQEEITQAREALTDQQQQIGGLQTEIQTLQQKLKTRKQLEKRLKKLEEREENLQVLSSMFRGSGFVNYASTVYLQNLCNAANERFQKLTRRRLRLEVDDDNEFRVRDFLNDGQTRSVKTLSGGQTFQAALSLALALADSIQHLTRSQNNFFFLDEGFGTLDKESLQIVFDTLKSLRKENRIVGIISHVEELQQELEMYLLIRNDEERGSLIQPSWEGFLQ